MSDDPEKYCEAWNFGPEDQSMITVSKITDLVINNWGDGSWENKFAEGSPYEANTLKLDITKATNLLEWRPVWGIDKAVEATVEWYKYYQKTDMYEFCNSQIQSYINDIY